MKPSKFSIGDYVEFNSEQTTHAFLQALVSVGEDINELRQTFIIEDLKHYPATNQWMIRIGSSTWRVETWAWENYFQHVKPSVSDSSNALH